jgi:hypothetical protein
MGRENQQVRMNRMCGGRAGFQEENPARVDKPVDRRWVADHNRLIFPTLRRYAPSCLLQNLFGRVNFESH